MTFTWEADSSPLRNASVVSGSPCNASAVSSTANASPTPLPVFSAIHDAADRWPSSRHAVPWVARPEYRTLPATTNRSSSAKTSKTSTAWAVVTRSGSASARWATMRRRASRRSASTLPPCHGGVSVPLGHHE